MKKQIKIALISFEGANDILKITTQNHHP